MSQIAEHCEAKKHAYRQTQDGVVVSFVLHPQEVPEGLALAALGTRYMLVVAEIGDNEKHKVLSDASTGDGEDIEKIAITTTSDTIRSIEEFKKLNPYKEYDTIKPETTKIDDKEYVVNPNNGKILDEKPKREMTLANRISIITETDINFWNFINTQNIMPFGCGSPEAAAEFVRQWCGVKSRSEITYDSEPAKKWKGLYEEYQEWLNK